MGLSVKNSRRKKISKRRKCLFFGVWYGFEASGLFELTLLNP